jgi:uncharacterized protein YaeQ
MRSLILLTCLTAIVLALSGCNTLDQRIKERRGTFDSLDAATQERLRTGRVALGDSEDALYIALGHPDERRIRENAQGRSELWIYTRSFRVHEGTAVTGYSRRMLRDRSGRVVAVSYDPVVADFSRIETEPVLTLTLREGLLVEIEETARN